MQDEPYDRFNRSRSASRSRSRSRSRSWSRGMPRSRCARTAHACFVQNTFRCSLLFVVTHLLYVTPFALLHAISC